MLYTGPNDPHKAGSRLRRTHPYPEGTSRRKHFRTAQTPPSESQPVKMNRIRLGARAMESRSGRTTPGSTLTLVARPATTKSLEFGGSSTSKDMAEGKLAHHREPPPTAKWICPPSAFMGPAESARAGTRGRRGWPGHAKHAPQNRSRFNVC